MSTTEDEAKELMCPARAGRVPEDDRCQASKCMAWRWLDRPYYFIENTEIVSEDKRGEISETVEQTTTIAHPHGNRHGFCGLAGDPNLSLKDAPTSPTPNVNE